MIKFDSKVWCTCITSVSCFVKLMLEKGLNSMWRKGKKKPEWPRKLKQNGERERNEKEHRKREKWRTMKKRNSSVSFEVLVIFFWGDLCGLYKVIWSLAMLISWLVIAHSFCFLNLNLRFSDLSAHCDHMEVYSNTSVWISPSKVFFMWSGYSLQLWFLKLPRWI